MNPLPPDRYDRVAVSIHWVVGTALLAQIAFGWLLDDFARGTPARALAINLHKSTGLVLALAIVLRLLWRVRHLPPAYPAGMGDRTRQAARLGHALLYVCMVGMPLSGYLASNFSKHGVNFFNRLPMPPWGPDDKAIYGLLNGTHDVLAYLFSALVLGHILFACYHGLVARDGLSSRMAFGSRRRSRNFFGPRHA
jgi:cytochrome b561